MKKIWLLAIVPGVLAAGAVAVVVALFAVKFLWEWTIPDIFPGAVKQGLIAAKLSWFTAFKVAIFVGVITSMARGFIGSSRD